MAIIKYSSVAAGMDGASLYGEYNNINWLGEPVWAYIWVSLSEIYYQDVMLQLEGNVTPEKEEFMRKERTNYEEAFDHLDQIAQMEERGEIDFFATETGKREIKKTKWKIALTLAAVAGAFTCITRFYEIQKAYPMDGWGMPMEAMSMQSMIGGGMLLLLGGLFFLLLYLLLYCGVTAIVLLISNRSNQTFLSYLLSSLLVIIPMLLALLFL